ncbi:MAG TPA: M67 family metallopeptidase [Candidatus Limnocylindrales bacterium]
MNERDMVPTPEEWAQVKRDPASVADSGASALLPAAIRAELLDALRAGVPNEACGVLVADRYWAAGGVPTRWISLHNAAQSPYRYLIDPQEQLRLWMDLDDADEVVWAIVHSHVASPARPSQTDIGLAFYPDSLYVVCSLSNMDEPDVRAWSIVDGAVSEVELVERD